MATDDTTIESDYETALNDHYGITNLSDHLLTALTDAGKSLDTLTRDDISSFDEFHIRGLDATRELAHLADIDAGAHVLDLGCGIGGPARTLAAQFDCTVAGIDIVEEFCNVATFFTNQLGLSDSVRFHHGNALDLPFERDEFDVIWLEHTLMNIKDKDRAFAEAGRVLTPGGTLAMYEICSGPGGDPVYPVPWADDPSLSYLTPPEHLRKQLREHGFTEVTWRDVSEPSLAWFRSVIEAMQSRPPDAPPPLGLNLLMGRDAPVKAKNVVQCLEEERIVVLQGVFRMEPDSDSAPSGSAQPINW